MSGGLTFPCGAKDVAYPAHIKMIRVKFNIVTHMQPHIVSSLEKY